MKNIDIRVYAVERNVKLWQIAKELRVNDGNFSRRLREELSKEAKQQIYEIIDKLAEGRQ
ncbi:MAG: hypothetical protein ACLSHX_02505 [Suilimivivens sp.]